MVNNVDEDYFILNTCCVLGTSLRAWDTAVKKIPAPLMFAFCKVGSQGQEVDKQ